MAYFPIFISLEDKNVLIVGAGKVAERKVEKLLPFNPNITVVAKDIKSSSIKKLAKEKKINLINRGFLFTDLDNKELVIVAVDNIDLQREIYNYCFRRKIPVNSVDNPKYCTFLFPAYVKEKEIVIGISTSGYAPALAKKLKEKIKQCLPENLEEVFEKLKNIRKNKDKGEERQNLIYKVLSELHTD